MKQISKPISFMRLRHLDAPEDMLEKYKPKNLVVQQKYDGFKGMSAKTTRRGVRLYSRKGTDVTVRAPKIVERLERMLKPGDTVLGEITYYHRGKQDIQKLQSIMGSKTKARAVAQLEKFGGQLEYVVYDLLSYQGKDLTYEPLSKRKVILNTLLPSRGMVHVAKDYPWSKRKLAMRDSLAKGGEGIVVKVKDSRYKHRKLGASEPFGLWWKHKPPGKSAYSADVILTKYKKGKEKLIFDAYQVDKSGKRILVGRLSGMDRESEKKVKRLIDKGKEVVAEVSYQKRLPSKKMRHMGWLRLRPDKPARSATIEQVRPREARGKKRSKITKAKKVTRNPKSHTVYLTAEKPNAIEVYSFRSRDYEMPGTAAYAHGLMLFVSDSGIKRCAVHDEKQLAKHLRKAGKRIRPGKLPRIRVSNPRRSVLKDALAAELLSYKNFDDFAKAYWENCSRGIYWYATDDKNFDISESDIKASKRGGFIVGCNPELAQRGKSKKYVAELKVTALGTKDYQIKRGSAGSEVKIVRNLNKVKVLRVLNAQKAARSLIWQQSILPSSKDELLQFYDRVVKKDRARKEREREKKKAKEEREALRAKHLKKKKDEGKRRTKIEKEEKGKREKKEAKEALKKETKKKGFKKARKEVKKEQEERRKTRSKKSGKKPGTKVAKTNPVPVHVNNPGF